MKRFVLIAIFATSFVLCGCSDDPDPDITGLRSDLDEKFDALQGEIEILKENVNALAAEGKVPLTNGVVPFDPRKDPDAVRGDTGGLPPSGEPAVQPVGDGLPPVDVPVVGEGQIVFVVRDADHNALSIMNPNGTGVSVMVELHRGAPIFHPALAPDGIGVAYTEGVFAGQIRIFVHRIDSPGRFLLGAPDGLYPAWSPDGRWIAWGDRTHIYISPSQANPNTRGGQLTHVSSNKMPTWSPDGRKIAFVSALDGDDNLFVINVDATHRIRITNNPADDRHPDWSPDGSQIAFQSHRDGSWDIFLVTLNTHVETQLTSGPAEYKEPSWSLDGRKLALAVEGEIYIINADGTGLTNITNSATHETSPDWQ